MDRLIVKNFGPLKDVDIELNKINLFIGENGSGKSVLGKIVTIILDFRPKTEIEILESFSDYNIDFISEDTVIQCFINSEIILEIKNRKIVLDEVFESDVDLKKATSIRNSLAHNTKLPKEIEEELLKFLNTNKEVIEHSVDVIKEKLEKVAKFISQIDIDELREKFNSQYIPAERNLISLFNKYITTFITADIPLPKFLLNFSSQYVRAREETKELDFLNVKYKFENDNERIYYDEENYLLLENSSSGIQSALPLYLTVKYFARKYHSIVIEEPEQNLFPKAQKETVEYIVEQINDENNLFMMTHSPYILTALNNLILANDVKEQKGLEAIEGIVKEKQCVPFENVSAYTLVDGKSVNIMDKENRLIGVNLIDSISDEVGDTFDTLLAKLD